MIIGSHVGMSGKDMLLGSAKEAVTYGADTFMFYTGAPQNTKRKDISELNIDPAWKYMEEHGIRQSNRKPMNLQKNFLPWRLTVLPPAKAPL